MMVSKGLFGAAIAVLLVQLSAAQEWSSIANPSSRCGARMIHDVKNERMVMFGGMNTRLPWGELHNDVWTLSLSRGDEAWNLLSPAGQPPSPRWQSAVVYDSTEQRMVVFGGRRDFAEPFNDVWILTLEVGNERWEEVEIAGVSPPARCQASAIYDPKQKRMVIFGGFSDGQSLNDLWSLDLVNFVWHRLEPSGIPPASRQGHVAIYDPLESRMIMFGGEAPDLESGVQDSLLSQRAPSTLEKVQYGNSDPSDSRMFVFGSKSTIGHFNDAWALDLTPGSESWAQLSVSGELPPAVSASVAGYDHTARRMYLYGGYVYPPFHYPEDIFYLDLSSLEWSRILLHDAPVGRRGLCGGFDHHNRRLIVFGGNRYYDYYFGDTYALAVPSGVIEDVAPASILSPPSGVFPDSAYSPSAIIRNYSPGWLGPIPVICTIDSWADSVEIVGIGGYSSAVVNFDSWVVPHPGVHTVTVITRYAGDTYTANDTFSMAVRGYIFGDVGGLSITSPPDTIYLGSTYTPSGVIQNFGTDSAGPMRVVCNIDSWTDTTEIPILSGADSTVVTFSNWSVVDTGVYSVTVLTEYPADTNSANDTLMKTVYATGPVSLDEVLRELPLPTVNDVCQSYPNPMSTGVTISYQVAERCAVNLSIFDNAGRLTRTLIERELEPGYYAENWDGTDTSGRTVPNGVYFYTLQAGEFTSTKKMILLR
jgi:hypothetical protein